MSSINEYNNVSMIVAMSQNRVIGKDGELPWHIPEDLKWFKKNTVGKTIIMGRHTHESIGKALPKRTNVVISRNCNYVPCSCKVLVYNDLQEAIESFDDVVIIGGAQIYKAAMPYVKRMFITKINHEFSGDTYFPEYNDDWEIKSFIKSSDDNYSYEFLTMERK